jgi:hypothetical protein
VRNYLKTLTCILLSFILVVNITNGQSMDSTIQKLVDIKLINLKQVKDFEEYLKNQDENNNAAYIFGLFQAEFKKLTGHGYSPLGTYLNFRDEKLKATEHTKINKEISVYLSKLKSCGLVTDKQFNDQSEKIKNNEYVHILQLLPYLANQSAYEEWLSPDRIIKYGNKLLANNVVSEKSFETLKNDINAEKIKSHYQLIDYCKNALFFDLAKYSNDPSIYLEQIHGEVSTLLPELSFTNFKYKIEVDSAESFKDYTSYKVVVSLKANGKTYKQKSFISPKDIGKDGNYLGKIDGQEFYQIFNKILSDNQSPLRLHQIQPNFQYGQPTNYQYFGVIALSKNQLDMFRYSSSYIQVSYEKFKNTLTTSRIDTAIKAYEQIGLLKHLTSTQVEEAKEKMKEQENRNLNDILACFPNVIYSFDTELSNLEDPYAELIRQYSNISQKEFNPTNISDDFDIEKKKKVSLKFIFKDKNYQKTFKTENDWMDADFFTFIKSVVTENKLDGTFYELYTGGQEASIIYLTQLQYDFLKANKLLVFGDEWQTEEE